jgi:hypothetical protein
MDNDVQVKRRLSSGVLVSIWIVKGLDGLGRGDGRSLYGI